MRKNTSIQTILAIILFWASSYVVQAQANRTFVSGAGSDANPCSILAPCRTFQAAHDAVAAGGEIVVLDSAGYGPVDISKSVSITAPDGVYAGITTSDDHGVYASGTGIDVYLRGLTIVGLSGMLPHLRGILFAGGASMVVDRCRVRGFPQGVKLSASGRMVIKDSVISDGYRGVSTDQGLVSPQLDIVGTVIERCTDAGVHISSGRATIRNSLVTDCERGIVTFVSTRAIVSNSVVFANTVGVNNAHDLGEIYLEETIIAGNTTGLETEVGGDMLSRSPLSNTIEGNTTNGTTTGTYSAK